jgi:hypothetical protein
MGQIPPCWISVHADITHEPGDTMKPVSVEKCDDEDECWSDNASVS